MSYYFGVWEGPAPLSNAHARSEFERRLAARGQARPVDAIQRLVDTLLEVHPDIDLPEGEESPWADAPLLHCVDGATAYLPVRPERVDSVARLIEQAADGADLVIFDPQQGTLLPSATEVDRSTGFELPPPTELALHLRALLGEGLQAPRPQVAVLEQIATGFYVQWLARDGSLTVEAQGDRVLPGSLRLTPESRLLMSELGFAETEPNWRARFGAGQDQVAAAAEAMARVLVEVRVLHTGEPMMLQTFPAN